MTAANDIIRSAAAEICRPWLRHILSHAEWIALADAAVAERWILLAYWADTSQAHALFLNPDAETVVPVSTPVEAGHYPALSPMLPAAAWYERMIHDLWGHQATGAGDLRPWLDHGHWPQSPPMAVRPSRARRVSRHCCPVPMPATPWCCRAVRSGGRWTKRCISASP